MRTLASLTPVIAVIALALSGCATEAEPAVEDTADEAALSANDDPRLPSKYHHASLARGGEAFVRDSRDSSAVHPSDVSQGHLNDCWVMSPLISLARTNPAAIERLIRKRADGDYDVTLYLGRTTMDSQGIHRAPRVFKVSPKFATDQNGELAYAKPQDTGPNGDELWPLLIEKAYAQYERAYDGPIAMLGSNLNGNYKPAFEAFLPDGQMDTYNTNGGDDRTMEVLADAFATHRPVTALTAAGFTDGMSAGTAGTLVTWHHYSVQAIDVANKTIDLEDPVRRRTGAKGLPVRQFRDAVLFYHVGPVAK